MIPAGPLKFTTSEKAALIAFLKTLTDGTSLTDPKFSNPFVDRKNAVKSVKATPVPVATRLREVVPAAEQAPAVLRSAFLVTEMPPVAIRPGAKSPQLMIDRLMSFDLNADHRLSRAELPERMQDHVARGDTNADAALDSDEIRSLVNAFRPERTRVSFRFQSPEGLPGVVKDLRLAPEKHARALAIVSAYKVARNVILPSSNELYGEMRALLDDEEYENFVAAAVRLSRSPRVMMK